MGPRGAQTWQTTIQKYRVEKNQQKILQIGSFQNVYEGGSMRTPLKIQDSPPHL